MLAGRFVIGPRAAKEPKDLAAAFDLDDGRTLRYRDDVQMGKVYLIERGAWNVIPGLSKVGLDVLDPKAFTKQAFRALAKKRKDQVKVFLMDKSALDAFGNAYADETCFAARIHPKAWVRSLGPEEVDRLHDAIVEVMTHACATIRERRPATDEKLRDFLKVRGRAGEPCARCGATLRKAGVHGEDAIFCPECQPDVRKSSIVDFRAAKRR
jgi:formamidopyrimidine-DNA glycosylase